MCGEMWSNVCPPLHSQQSHLLTHQTHPRYLPHDLEGAWPTGGEWNTGSLSGFPQQKYAFWSNLTPIHHYWAWQTFLVKMSKKYVGAFLNDYWPWSLEILSFTKRHWSPLVIHRPSPWTKRARADNCHRPILAPFFPAISLVANINLIWTLIKGFTGIYQLHLKHLSASQGVNSNFLYFSHSLYTLECCQTEKVKENWLFYPNIMAKIKGLFEVYKYRININCLLVHLWRKKPLYPLGEKQYEKCVRVALGVPRLKDGELGYRSNSNKKPWGDTT